MRGISWLAENRLASQDGLCSMEYICFVRIVIRLRVRGNGTGGPISGVSHRFFLYHRNQISSRAHISLVFIEILSTKVLLSTFSPAGRPKEKSQNWILSYAAAKTPKTRKEKSTFLTGIDFALTCHFWTLCLNRNIPVSKGNRNMVIQHDMSVANDLADPNIEAYFRKLIRVWNLRSSAMLRGVDW